MTRKYIVVIGFIAFDIVTGIIKALYQDGVNSTVLRKGLFNKLSEVLALFGSALFEYAVTYVNLGVELPVTGGVSLYICMMEGVSILENLGEINPKLGTLFQPYLEKLKRKNGDDEKRN